MKISCFFKSAVIPVLLWVTLCSCAVTGDVVKVTTVQDAKFEGLQDADRAKLDEIRKLASRKGLDNNLSKVIEKTSHYSVSEYLQKFPYATDLFAKDYRVGGYDLLNIMIYEEKDLSKESLRVSADGYITFPLIGRIKVENLTTSEIEKLIADKLAQGEYLLDAHVSVMVTDYKSKKILVLGAVNNPGSYPLQARERVLDAISKAGGVRRAEGNMAGSGGAGKKCMIIRTENPDTAVERKIIINLDLKGLLEGGDQIANIFMSDKDVLFIPTAEHFYIIGQVKEPGSYVLTDREITLVEAISRAGGFTTIAARNRTRIIRVVDGVEKIITVKVDAITDAGKKINDVIIQPNDVIVIPESFF